MTGKDPEPATQVNEVNVVAPYKLTGKSTIQHLRRAGALRHSEPDASANDRLLIYACFGSTFEFRRKKLVGSYLFLRATNRGSVTKGSERIGYTEVIQF